MRLRPLRFEDLPAIHRWYQDPEVTALLVGELKKREEAEAVDYMRRWLAPSATEVRLAVEDAADGAFVGMTGLHPIDRAASQVEFHIVLGDPARRGRGIGRAATTATLQEAFGPLGLARVTLHVLSSNPIARRLYDGLGFEVTGVETAAVVKAGQWVDVTAMVLDASAFEAALAK